MLYDPYLNIPPDKGGISEISPPQKESPIPKPPWVDEDLSLPLFPALDSDIHAEICIIGAGICGLSIAYELINEGKNIVLIESGEIGSGETGRTTAHLSNALDDRYYKICKDHGYKSAKIAADSHMRAIDRIEEIIQIENIDCNFERLDGYLFLAPGHPFKVLFKELEATLKIGLNGTSLINNAPLIGPCLKFPNQGQFHPIKYLAGLARCIHEKGGLIFTNTHIKIIEAGIPIRLETAAGNIITADKTVIATNAPVFDPVRLYTKQVPNRTYVVAAWIPGGIVPKALYWDTAQPYHYVRLYRPPLENKRAHDLLIIGGEDRRVGDTKSLEMQFIKLETWARLYFPQISSFSFRWSGQILEPLDSLGFIGTFPTREKNIYVATGDSGNGMTNGAIAGMLIKDLILGHENGWASLYDPSRNEYKYLSRFILNNLKGASTYLKYLIPSKFKAPDNLKPGQGIIIQKGLRKVATACDEKGNIKQCSAICTHLGGLLSWNPIEKTWDCPVHGSRFDLNGNVLDGPAMLPLEKSGEVEKLKTIPKKP